MRSNAGRPSGLENATAFACGEIRVIRKAKEVDMRTAAFISAINRIGTSYADVDLF